MAEDTNNKTTDVEDCDNSRKISFSYVMAWLKQWLKRAKTYALFISMAVGFIFSPWFTDVSWFTGLFVDNPQPFDLTVLPKYFLFCMLFITYCKVSPSQMRYNPMFLWLVVAQWVGCWLLWALLMPFNAAVANGAFVCVMICTATSAPVITGMLGGSVPMLATFSIAGNLAIALIAPLFLSLMGVGAEAGEEAGFWQCFVTICKKVIPLALGPFAVALIVKRVKPNIHLFFQTHQAISFWLWCLSLVLLMARTMGNLLAISSNEYVLAAMVALGALVACCLQFYVGRKIGRKFNDPVVGGQALGQKNTILAIWIAQTFFDPQFDIVSIAPASYVLWQNLINSWQIWRFNKKS